MFKIFSTLFILTYFLFPKDVYETEAKINIPLIEVLVFYAQRYRLVETLFFLESSVVLWIQY